MTFAIRCRHLSQITLFALKRDICLSPDDEHGSLTLAPLTRNSLQGSLALGQHDTLGSKCAARKQLWATCGPTKNPKWSGKGGTEGIGGQGQGALGHSGQQEGTALSSNVDLSI